MRLAAGDFADDGVCVAESVVPLAAVRELRNLAVLQSAGRPGARAFSVPHQVAGLIQPGGALTDLAKALMGAEMRAVRVLYFDKTAKTNWAVPWHQDRTIAVAGRIDAPGYGHWSIKAGVHHVEPPEAILSGVASLRSHLDNCGRDNGPLLALRGSSRLGRVAAGEIRRHVEAGLIEICCANAGDVVAMRGLTLHASERAARPDHRRVIHVDFSAAELPGGLQWALA